MNKNMQETKTNEQETQEAIQVLPKLRPKMHVLCEELLKGTGQIEAHKIAGFKGKNDQCRAVRMNYILKDTKAQEYLRIRTTQIQAKINEITDATVIKTVQEIARIGYCDPKNIFDADGNMLEVPKIDENTRRAIASVEVETRTTKAGEEIKTQRLKFWNKNDALQKIGVYLGILVERKDIRSTKTTVETLDLSKVTNDDLAELSNRLKKVQALSGKSVSPVEKEHITALVKTEQKEQLTEKMNSN
jgi:phage terminase small subunit